MVSAMNGCYGMIQFYNQIHVKSLAYGMLPVENIMLDRGITISIPEAVIPRKQTILQSTI